VGHVPVGHLSPILLFVGPTEVLLPYVVKHELGGSATALALVLTSGGPGGRPLVVAPLPGWRADLT